MQNHTLAQSAAAVLATASVTLLAFIAYQKYTEVKPKKTLYERLGGDAAIELVVGKFYQRMLNDPRVARFFKDTKMAAQHAKQVSFISYVFGSPKKYSGLAMDVAHRRLVRDMGMNDSHFDATKENLDLTLAEVGVPKGLREEVATLFESLREQVLCRGKWAIEEKSVPPPNEAKKTLYERLGGEVAIDTVVRTFYDRMLSDKRVAHFFKNTNMATQHAKQVSFISHALGAPKKFSGLAMDVAHRRLVKDMGMNDSHFDATKENLDTSLAEVGVPKDLREEVATAFESLREQVMCRGKWAQ